MEALSMAHLRAILRMMNRPELEDMICTLYRSSDEIALFFNVRYNTEEYIFRLLHTYQTKLAILFTYTDGCGNAQKIKNCLMEFINSVTDQHAILELLVFCVEHAIKWACEGEISAGMLNEFVEVFQRFVEVMNQLADPALFLSYKSRLEQMEWDSGAVGMGFGEVISDLCAELDGWGEK